MFVMVLLGVFCKMTISALTDEYVLIAADISALSIIQVPIMRTDAPGFAEVLAAGSAPSEDARGTQLVQGDTAIGDARDAIGTSGGLYARRYHFGYETDLYTA